MSAGTGGSNWKPLIEILVVIIGIWVIWYFTGGPERAVRVTDPYQNAPSYSNQIP